MTANDIYNKAVILLGYDTTPPEPQNPDRFSERGLTSVKEICRDLKIAAPMELSSEIIADETKLDALVYGTAMLLSLIEGDVPSNRFFTDIYNQKRSSAKAQSGIVKDVLPKVSGGEI